MKSDYILQQRLHYCCEVAREHYPGISLSPVYTEKMRGGAADPACHVLSRALRTRALPSRRLLQRRGSIFAAWKNWPNLRESLLASGRPARRGGRSAEAAADLQSRRSALGGVAPEPYGPRLGAGPAL